ncbi:MAG: UDP-N-acetylmuramate dehydrogenase [Bacteroidia bacterium]|jgi:UDP-N-acetylmuramate dehydrogenase
MNIQNNKDLTALNTFGMAVKASSYAEVTSLDDISNLIYSGTFQDDFFILGGGSNVLFVDDFKGTVVRNCLKGISVLSEDDNHVHIEIGAGENWHQIVLHCVNKNWGGIENLSLIPGCVGAAPIQNIGAYGVEIKDVLERVHFVELTTGVKKSLENKQCQFGYRNSIFKQTLNRKVIITAVELKLTKKHALRMDYGAIKDKLAASGIINPKISDVSDAVISIRQSKLPDPAELGNSGSFFKNPIIEQELFDKIKSKNADVRCYPVGNGCVKVAAGWLIEQCGWKGKRVGNTGSHAKQALVLVNYGGAKGAEIVALAQSIIQSVKDTFSITLEPEVNIL